MSADTRAGRSMGLCHYVDMRPVVVAQGYVFRLDWHHATIVYAMEMDMNADEVVYTGDGECLDPLPAGASGDYDLAADNDDLDIDDDDDAGFDIDVESAVMADNIAPVAVLRKGDVFYESRPLSHAEYAAALRSPTFAVVSDAETGDCQLQWS